MKSLSLMNARLPVGLLLATMVTHSVAASDQPSQNVEQELVISQQELIKPVATENPSAYPRYSTDLQQAIEAAMANPKEAKSQKISVMIKSTKGSQEKLVKQLKKQGAHIQSSMIADTIMAVVSPQTLKEMAKSPLITTASVQGVVYASVAESSVTSEKESSKPIQAINALTSTEVALNLLKRAASSQPDVSENIIFSPWSIIEATTAVMLANDEKNPIARPDWLFPSASQQDWLTAYATHPESTNFRSKNYSHRTSKLLHIHIK